MIKAFKAILFFYYRNLRIVHAPMVRIANTASNIRNPIFHNDSSAWGLSLSTSIVNDKEIDVTVKINYGIYIQRIIKLVFKEKPKSLLFPYLYGQADKFH